GDESGLGQSGVAPVLLEERRRVGVVVCVRRRQIEDDESASARYSERKTYEARRRRRDSGVPHSGSRLAAVNVRCGGSGRVAVELRREKIGEIDIERERVRDRI